MRILWIPHYAWRNPQRARLFCERLSERHEVHVTDVYTDIKTLRDYASWRYLEGYFYGERKDGRITVHRIPRVSPALPFRALRSLNSRVFSKYVDRIIKKEGIEAVVGTFLCRPPKVRRLIFDLFDDNPAYWREYGRFKEYADEIEAVEQEYIDKADEVVVVSSVLGEKVRGRKVHLIPNGVDLEKFGGADGDKVRKELNLKGVVAGFISVFSEFSGLLRLVKSSELISEDLTFLIVGDGPMVWDAKRYIEKKGIENFVFTGRVSFNEIHHYFKAIDIGLLPFDKKRFTDSACPIKLLEYTAAGKPVVATELEEIKRMNFSNVILVKDDPASLARGIREALDSEVEIPREIEEYDIDKLAGKYERVILG